MRKFLKKLGIVPKYYGCYLIAIRHPSVGDGFSLCGARTDYRSLALLGDSFLDLHLIFRMTQESVGTLQDKSFIKKQLSRNSLGELCIQIGLSKLVESRYHSLRNHILGEFLEAFFGALYIDQGPEKAHEIAHKWFSTKKGVRDVKSDLLVLVKKTPDASIKFTFSKSGEQHCLLFKAKATLVYLGGVYKVEAEDSRKLEAQKKTCAQLLKLLHL